MNELIHLRIEPNIKKEILEITENNNFSSVSEFVKDAIRKSIEDYKKKIALQKISEHLGAYPDKKLKLKMKKEAANEALAYKGDIFKDLGLK
jgi:Arc/MetJ-type ribon-helix-helix transcriptional regulator